MQKKLLTGMDVLTMDRDMRQINHGEILIEGDRITELGPKGSVLGRLADQHDIAVIDLQGRWVLPGFINTHVHLSQQLARGLGDDVPLLTWLHERIWPYESNMTEEDSYISSLLCGAEMIRSGVTCFAEAGGQHLDGMGRAMTELGMRSILARSTMDMGEGLPPNWRTSPDEALDAQIAHMARWHGQAEGRIQVWFGLRTIFNNSDELILRTKALADDYGVGVHMHVAEVREEVEFARETRGATTVTHLNKLGVLDKNFLAVHTVWLTDEEIRIFAEKDVKVSHNPASAMRVLGMAKVPEMIDAGVCVSIGTDGAPSNNRMSMVDELWVTSLLHKVRLLDPTALPAEKVLAMATYDGARALLMEDQVGSLAVGKKADLVVIDPHTTGMLPMHDPVANMVTSMRGENIESVMVDGQWLMFERALQTVDEAALLEQAQEQAHALRQRAGIKLPGRFDVTG